MPATGHTAEPAPLRICLFAALREQAGWSERNWPFAPATTPRQLWQALQLPGRLDALRVAINQEFAHPEAPLQPGDEVAFLPPISGG